MVMKVLDYSLYGSIRFIMTISLLVQNLTEFTASSFTLTSNGRRNLNEGLSVNDFKGLYFFDAHSVSILTSYFDFSQGGSLSPDSSIAGTYTCIGENESAQNVTINVISMCSVALSFCLNYILLGPSGLFSHFTARFNAGFISNLTAVNDEEYQISSLETLVCSELSWLL